MTEVLFLLMKGCQRQEILYASLRLSHGRALDFFFMDRNALILYESTEGGSL
jgi:hypothetical protein